MAAIEVRRGVIAQRDIRVHGYRTLAEGFDALGDSLDPTESVVVLSFRRELYELNVVGALLWERLSAGATERDLVSFVAERYGLPSDDAAKDVKAFLDSMHDFGIIGEVV